MPDAFSVAYRSLPPPEVRRLAGERPRMLPAHDLHVPRSRSLPRRTLDGTARPTLALALATTITASVALPAGEQQSDRRGESTVPSTPKLVVQPDLFTPLTEPPCSYCSTQHRKGLVDGKEPVIAWLRASHNGGAIPIRHFLAAPRVINDTYGLFFYDPDGGYVAAFRKDYGYRFHGWRGGVMVAQGPDGTLWSALSGVAFDGPKKGQHLERVASVVTTWEHWLMLHPESTAYDLFDGKKYPRAPLPVTLSDGARESMGAVDPRLGAETSVLGVTVRGVAKAYPLDPETERASFLDEVAGEPIAVLWYGPTTSAVAFHREVEGSRLTLRADSVSPETAPFRDDETGTRWTIAGRGVDGPLRGKELRWVDSIQCRWYAWTVEHPKTELWAPPASER